MLRLHVSNDGVRGPMIGRWKIGVSWPMCWRKAESSRLRHYMELDTYVYYSGSYFRFLWFYIGREP